jgi:hypothetical protein
VKGIIMVNPRYRNRERNYNGKILDTEIVKGIIMVNPRYRNRERNYNGKS